MCRYKGSYYYSARSVPPTIISIQEDEDDSDDNGGDAYFDGESMILTIKTTMIANEFTSGEVIIRLPLP